MCKAKKISFPLFWIVITAVYVAVFTTIDYADNPFAGVRGLLTIVAQAGVTVMGVAGLFGLLAIDRRVFAVCFPVVVTASAIMAYYRVTLGIVLSAATAELMIVNDFSVWATLISPLMIIVAVVALLLSVAVVAVRWRRVVIASRLWWFLGCLVLFLIPNIVPRLQAPLSTRMPFCFYYAMRDYMVNRREASAHREYLSTVAVSQRGDRPDVIFVIGESLRADHLGINGYHRPTTPLLEADTAVVSYPYVTTRHYATHQSVPHILTRADSADPDPAFDEESFITLFKRLGYDTYWISNQDKNSGYAYFMEEADSVRMIAPGWTPRNFIRMHDEDMLPYAGGFLKSGEGRPKLLVLHAIGSHWLYNLSHPEEFEVYTPGVNSRVISELTQEQLINSYDNTVLATDHFLARLIGMVRERDAILIYISDHGEALGEDGLHLHGFEAPGVQSTACLFWYSPAYAALHPDRVENLRRNADGRWLNDVIFHSVLDAAGIETPVLDASLSVFSAK